MTSARSHVAATIAAIGILMTADTFLLLYLGRGLFPSQNVLSLTAGFVVLQEAILFGILIYIAMTAGRSSIALPVHLGYVSVLVTCSLFAILIIAVFDALLTFGLVGIKAYWTALTMRQATLLIFLLGIHLVGIIQRASHREAEQQRTRVEDLVRACERVSISARLAGWEFEGKLNDTIDHLRFCEALRREPTFFGEVLAKVSELESLARVGGEGETKTRAYHLLTDLAVLSQRRA